MSTATASLAKLIDLGLHHPTLTDAQLRAGCEKAKKLGVATVCIKPHAVKLAAEILKGSDVAVCTVISFPHGTSATEIKAAEAQQACDDGAVELDMVINIGKALGGDWEYVERDIKAVLDVAHKNGAILKVIFENDYLSDDVENQALRNLRQARRRFRENLQRLRLRAGNPTALSAPTAPPSTTWR